MGVTIVLPFTVGESPPSRSSFRIKLLLPVIWFPLICAQQVVMVRDAAVSVVGGEGRTRPNVDGAILRTKDISDYRACHQ